MSPLYVARRGRPPLRFTRRGTYAAGALVAAAVVAAVAVLLVALLSVVRVVQRECVVSGGVRLSTADAEEAATVVARVIRQGGDQAAARRALRQALDLSPAEATPVAMALAGRHEAALSCTHGDGSSTDPALRSPGLTARADAVRLDMKATWPRVPLGGFAPGGVHSGHMKGSAHYEGRAIDAFFRPIGPGKRRLGWAMAQYYVAMADRFDIATVIFDGRIWTARRADEGWRDYHVSPAGRSAATVAVLEHRDHVHVDVAG